MINGFISNIQILYIFNKVVFEFNF